MSREVSGLSFRSVVSTTHREGLRFWGGQGLDHPLSSVRSSKVCQEQKFEVTFHVYFRGLEDTQPGDGFGHHDLVRPVDSNVRNPRERECTLWMS